MQKVSLSLKNRNGKSLNQSKRNLKVFENIIEEYKDAD